MSLIKGQGAGEVSTGFYRLLLDQSIKFNDDDAQYLKRTPASDSNRKTLTWSAWVKRCTLGSYQNLFTAEGDGGNDSHTIRFDNSDRLDVIFLTDGSDSITGRLVTNRVFRDVNAWYHILYVQDTTSGTAGDRLRLYVNGVEETSFSTDTNPTQNHDGQINGAVLHRLGAPAHTDSQYFDGYIAEVNLIDGTALTPASFGETKNGIWTPKDTSGLTFGTNGFHLTFKDDVVSEGFNAVTYRGNNGSGADGQSISGLGFEPALIWIGNRTNASTNFVFFDYARGDQEWLETSSTDPGQDSGTYGVQSHDADGWTMGGGNDINRDGEPHVAWCWEAGGEPTATNSAGAGATPTAGSVKIDGSNLGSALAGTIPATKLSANTSKGFSVLTYTGTGSIGTVAHGLGATPKWMIIKNRSTATWFNVYHTSLGATKYVRLNSNVGEQTNSNVFNDTEPTSTVFTVATVNDVNASGDDYVAYVWSEVSGYSKFGSFTGNGGSQAIDVGFEPAFVLLKRTNSSSWGLFDNTRQPANTGLQSVSPNIANGTETTNANMVFSGNTFNDNGYYSDNGTTVLYMAFADTRDAAFFKDVTSNGNHFAPVNLDYRDSVPDVPTNNFATFNPLNSPAAVVLSEGNTKFTQTSNDRAAIGNMAMSSGKWYYEVYYTAGSNPEAGLARVKDSFANSGATGSSDKFLYITNATSFRTPAWTSTDATGVSAQTSETVLGFAIDADNGKAFISVNGTYINSGNPAAGSNPQATFDADWVTQTGGGVVPFIGMYTGTSGDVRINFGQDSSFSGAKATANSNADGNGHGSFQYAPPSGFLALCSQNLPDVDIIDGTEHFDTITYAGSASNQTITTNFQADFLWFKERTTAGIDHNLFDSVRLHSSSSAKFGRKLESNTTDAETDSTVVVSQSTNDITLLGGISTTNDAFSRTYVMWHWLAATAFSNDASATSVGTIDSSGRVNTTAGFSIVSYEGSGSNATIAHGLNSAPEMLIVKNRENGAGLWLVYHAGIASDAETDYIHLESTNAAADDNSAWNDTAPTSSVFSVGTSVASNQSGKDHIAYCFHSVEGYSKVGSYVGNGNSDGPFIHTGFRPAWIMIKNITDAGEHWEIWDSTRDTDNVVTQRLRASSNGADVSSTFMDFLSNGVKHRNTSGGYNASGKTFIYLAFADQPVKFSNAR